MTHFSKTWENCISPQMVILPSSRKCFKFAKVIYFVYHKLSTSDSHIVTHRSTSHPDPLIDTCEPGRPARHLVGAPSILINHTEATYQHEAHDESHTDRPEEPCEDQEEGIFVHLSLVATLRVREIVDDKAVARVQHLKMDEFMGILQN